jgi:ankyrin repeat protein
MSMQETITAEALIWVAAWGDVKATKALLAKGADPNAKDNEGKTALKVASERDHSEVVDLLKAHGEKE